MSVTIKDKLQVQGIATSQLVLQVGGGCPSDAGGQREMCLSMPLAGFRPLGVRGLSPLSWEGTMSCPQHYSRRGVAQNHPPPDNYPYF